LLNKVPEVVIWFWIIKVLCTTVGESFADWINETLGVGLLKTSLLFTTALAAVLFVQVRLPKYVPIAYWMTVVVLSVTGTLYTDILTDQLKVPLALSTSVFAVLLAVVFGIWYAREGTLSIHSIVTRPREAFYWLAVLVTFALGTAAGDWILDLTGWPPGKSVLLPAGLIIAVVVGWRLGANPVLSFWLAYILTRPLGANLGDYLALPKSEGGLGLGTAGTSIVFLAAILATVAYLTVSRRDVIELDEEHERHEPAPRDPQRERIMLVYFAVVAIAAGGILAYAHAQPHSTAAAAEEAPAATTGTTISAQQATQNFPTATVTELRTISQDALTKVQAGDRPGATAAAKELETTWDDDQSTLQPLDQAAWTFLDGQIDAVLQSIRAKNSDSASETSALTALIASLG
jgi:uncharacterized membrane-anchored protein